MLVKKRFYIALVFVSLLLSSCSFIQGIVNVSPLLSLFGGGEDKPAPIATKSIELRNSIELNSDFPLAIDIAFIFDSNLMKIVSTISARDWFSNRKQQFKRDYPLGLSIREYELVPGGEQRHVEVSEKERVAISSFVFANYRKAGIHRARLDKIPSPIIRLSRETFSISSQPQQ
jgi:type VI secretion system protein